MMFNDKALKSFEEQDALTAEQLTMTTRLSYEQEVGRYESLMERGNKMLTSIAIVFATLAVLLQVLIEHTDALAEVGNPLVITEQQKTFFYLFVLFVVCNLVGSFITALLSSRRFDYEALKPPGEIAEWIEGHELFANKTIAALHFSRSLQESYETYYERNEKIRKLQTVSMVLLIISICVAAIGGLVTMLHF